MNYQPSPNQPVTHHPLPKDPMRHYTVARFNLLLVAVFSVVNILLSLLTVDWYFFFSAYLPYYLVDAGMWYCGLYPKEYYFGMGSGGWMHPTFLVSMLIFALLCVVLYVLAWRMSKRHGAGWLIFALVFFSVDTLWMLINFWWGSFLYIAFHVWVIVSLSLGIRGYYAARAAAASSHGTWGNGFDAMSGGNPVMPDSPVLRPADMQKPGRTLVTFDMAGRSVVFRRLHHTNELIVDGLVYAEKKGVFETAHTVVAWVGGHYIESGFDGWGHSFIRIDGQTVARKLRLY